MSPILGRKTTQNGLPFVTRCGIEFRGKGFDSKLSASGAPDRQSCSIVSLRSKAIGELLYTYLVIALPSTLDHPA